jgi:hypothetical protein
MQGITGIKIGISVASGSINDTTEANLDYIGMETQPMQIFIAQIMIFHYLLLNLIINNKFNNKIILR